MTGVKIMKTDSEKGKTQKVLVSGTQGKKNITVYRTMMNYTLKVYCK